MCSSDLKSWARIENPPINWWDIPEVRQRWNKKVSGRKDLSHQEYFAQKYFAGVNLLTGLSWGCGRGEVEMKWAATGKFARIDAFDLSENRIAFARKAARENGLTGIIDFRVGDVYAIEMETEKYDFIFIDGAHKLRYVMKDLSWARLLTVGGILCLHDYHIKTKGVILAANRFLRRYKNYTKVSVVNKLLVLRKNGESNIPEISKVDHIYANVISLLLQIEHSVYKRIKRLR